MMLGLLNKSESEDSAEDVNSKENKEELARNAAQALVRKFALEAIWPNEQKDYIETSLFRLSIEMSKLFGKKVDDLSLSDIERAQAKLMSVCKSFKLVDIKYNQVTKAKDFYQSTRHVLDFLSYSYSIGSVFYGNFGPIIRKLGIQTTGIPISRVIGVWLAGQLIVELYFDAEAYNEKKVSPLVEYHPIFDSFTLEQFRELSQFMNIKALVSWDEEELKEEILSEIKWKTNNKITALWADIPDYKSILLMLCGELKIQEATSNLDEKNLEERIIRKVLAESMDKMNPEELKKFKQAIIDQTEDSYLSDGVKSSAVLGALAVGNLSGFGFYLAASSALSAFTNGLGVSFAFATYGTMSGALGVVFGPIGIALATTTTGLIWSRSQPLKALPFILYIAAARGQIELAAKEEKNGTKMSWGKSKEKFKKMIFK